MHRALAFVALILVGVLAGGARPTAPHAGSAAQARRLHLAARWPIGGEGGWDYLAADTTARRLYVSHGTRVEVLDLDRGTPIGAIEPTPGVHGVAIAPDLRRGFVSCGRDTSVVEFDLDSLRVLQSILVTGRNPDAILYEPVSHRILTFNGGGANATVLDATTGVVVGSIALGGKPEFAVADGRGAVFVNIEDTSELVRLDPIGLAVVKRWSLAPGEEPSGLALDRARHRLFSVCSNRLMVVSDAERGAVVGTAPIGTRVDGVAYDAKRRLAISSNGEGTVTVVRERSPDRYETAETDSTELGARTIALDGRTGAVFVSTASFGETPAPTPDRPHPRPAIVPGTFHVLVLRP